MLDIRSLLVGAGIFAAAWALVSFTPSVVVPEARAQSGQWTCYVVDKFPKLDKAREWEGARNYSDALNQVAPHVESGRILVGTYPVGGFGAGQGGAPILCVKQ